MIVKERVATGVLKKCSKCKKNKDTSQFNTHSCTRDRLDSCCYACKATAARRYYWKNVKRLRKQSRLYSRKNKKKLRASKLADPRKFLLCYAKYRAKKQGLAFRLTVNDIVVPVVCPVLGIPLVIGRGIGGAIDASPTIDRRIPEKGYVPENITVMSKRANVIKNNATVQEIRKLLAWMERK